MSHHDSVSEDRPPTTRPDEAAFQVETAIAELVANSAGLAEAASQNAQMLATLIAEQSAMPGWERPRGRKANGSAGLPPDVLRVAVVRARAAGLSVGEYLRDAVLAYDAPAAGARRPARPTS